MEYIAESSV